MMTIQLANTEREIQACYPVMRELRPHLVAEEFIAQVRNQALLGYRLVFACQKADVPLAVAGFRITQNLAWGRFLYVDDLVTLPAYRSSGYGAQLLAWLKTYALEQGCQQLHLDSGLQRLGAHRFYQREQVIKTGFHFAVQLEQ